MMSSSLDKVIPDGWLSFWPLVVAVVLLVGIKCLVRPGRAEVRYRRQDAVLSAAERSFFGVLLNVIPAGHHLSFKVRLADVIQLAGKLSRGDWQRAFNKISAKHVDFLLCRADDLRVVLAIELDDASHQKKARVERDRFVEAALKSAQVPLLRVDVRKGYALPDLREKVMLAIGGEGVG